MSCVDDLERRPLFAGGSPGSDSYGACTDDETGAQADAETGSSSESLYCKPESEQDLVTMRRDSGSRLDCRQLLFLGTLAAITMTSSLSLCIFPPFFPRIAEDKGFSVSVYGAIIGTNCLVSFVVTPFLGRHIESLGLGFTLVSGVMASGIACILCGMLEMFPAGMAFVWTAVAIRTVQSVGNAGIIICTFTYSNMLYPTRTGFIFALNRTVMSVAQMFGPALGGIFYELGGYWTPFVVFGILHVTTAAPLWCVLPTTGTGTDDKSKTARADQPSVSVWGMLKMHSIWVAFTTFFVSTMSTGFLSITLEAQILRKYELSHVVLGMMFGLKDGTSSIASPIWGLLCDKFRCVKSYIVVTSLAAALCFAMFGPVPALPFQQTLTIVIAALCVYGVAIGGMQVSAVVDALREATRNGLPDDATTNAVVTGMWNSMSGAGRFISRCGAGILVDGVGFPMSAGVIVLLHLFMALYAAAYSCVAAGRRSHPKSSKKSRRRRLPSASNYSSERDSASPASSDDLAITSSGSSSALQVPSGRRPRYGSDGRPLTYFTHSLPDCAGSYGALIGDYE